MQDDLKESLKRCLNEIGPISNEIMKNVRLFGGVNLVFEDFEEEDETLKNVILFGKANRLFKESNIFVCDSHENLIAIPYINEDFPVIRISNNHTKF